MNNLKIECIKSEISNIDKKIISINKELSKLHNNKKKLEIRLIAMDTRTENERLRDEYSVEGCFNTIRDEEHLWDLRYWNNDHDRTEVTEWLNEFIKWNIWFDKNVGHCTYMMYILIVIHKVDKKKVVDAIMDNKFVSYKNNIGELV